MTRWFLEDETITLNGELPRGVAPCRPPPFRDQGEGHSGSIPLP
jgi:hypothetical protein